MSGSFPPHAPSSQGEVGVARRHRFSPRCPPRGSGTARVLPMVNPRTEVPWGMRYPRRGPVEAWRGCVWATPPPCSARAGGSGASGSGGGGEPGNRGFAMTKRVVAQTTRVSSRLKSQHSGPGSLSIANVAFLLHLVVGCSWACLVAQEPFCERPEISHTPIRSSV